MDNCIGINNRRYYLMLWNTITLLMAMAIYPLSLLDQNQPASGQSSFGLEIKVLASTQLAMAAFGFVLSFFYTLYLWYAGLTGIY